MTLKVREAEELEEKEWASYPIDTGDCEVVYNEQRYGPGIVSPPTADCAIAITRAISGELGRRAALETELEAMREAAKRAQESGRQMGMGLRA